MAELVDGSLPALLRDLRRARRGGPEAIAARQRARLADLVARTRAGSPYYRELYRDLPERVTDVTALPVTDKARLMDRFDDWSTDRAVTRAAVTAHLDRPGTIGTRLLDSYLVVTTSGTSGLRGVFVQDERMFRVLTALSLARSATRFLHGWSDWRALLRNGGRTAAIWATDGHYAGYATAQRLLAERPSRRSRMRILSVHRPLPELVAELGAFRPAIVNGYASAIALAAAEQEAGRLHIDPVLVITAAEGLPDEEYARVARAFGATVRDQYGCSEFMGLANGCAARWLHVNADWAVLEPVDERYRPVPPGEPGHTVLLTNLANRVQPVLRYDLGDRVVLRPDPCPCGDPLPAVRVQGRTGDVLTFAAGGGEVRIPPLALATAVDRTPGVRRFQVLQDGPTSVRVRLEAVGSADPDQVWTAVRAALLDVLGRQGVTGARVERDDAAPQRSAGGKFRPVRALG